MDDLYLWQKRELALYSPSSLSINSFISIFPSPPFPLPLSSSIRSDQTTS